eukprot:6587747-Prymnesium_polylepis.1
MARVDDDEAAHQLLRPLRYLPPPPALKVRRSDALPDLLRVAERNVEEHAEAPHVAGGVVGAVRAACLEHLRCEVRRRTAERRRDALAADDLSEP